MTSKQKNAPKISGGILILLFFLVLIMVFLGAIFYFFFYYNPDPLEFEPVKWEPEEQYINITDNDVGPEVNLIYEEIDFSNIAKNLKNHHGEEMVLKGLVRKETITVRGSGTVTYYLLDDFGNKIELRNIRLIQKDFFKREISENTFEVQGKIGKTLLDYYFEVNFLKPSNRTVIGEEVIE